MNFFVLFLIASLAALVYQHSLTALALPLKLILPSQDLTVTSGSQTGSTTTNGHLVNSASHNSQLNGHHDETTTTTSANNSRQNTLSKQQSVQNTSSSSDGRQLLDKGAGKYTTL